LTPLPTRDDKDSIYIADKENEPDLFKALEQIKGKKIKTKRSWVSICTICSRILGKAITEYFERVFDKEYKQFDFNEYEIRNVRNLINKDKVLSLKE